MNPTEKSLTFFKVFDLAFFAPGVVIALTLAWVFREHLGGLDVAITKASGVLAVVLAIGGIYAVGLAIFSAMWWIFRGKARAGPEEAERVGPSGWPRFPLLFDGAVQDELILYFWYLRATCFGVAAAFVLSALILLGDSLYGFLLGGSRSSLPFGLTAGLILVLAVEGLAAWALVRQGQRFDRGVDGSLGARAVQAKREAADPALLTQGSNLDSSQRNLPEERR